MKIISDYIEKDRKMKNKILMFWFIVAIVIISSILIVIKPTKLGLDLVGGSRLVLEAETTDSIAKITPEVMNRLQFAIEQRVNKLGVAETVVQQVGEKRLLIEIPNVTDLKEAKAFIGETAQLEFKKEGKAVKPKEKDKLQPLIISKDQTDLQKTFNQIEKYYKENK